MASGTHLFDGLWEEKFDYFFGLDFAGHCHTYNPSHKSLSGHAGQLYALLGGYPIMFWYSQI